MLNCNLLNYLVVDSDFESGGAPVDELDGPLGLDGGDGRVHVLGDDVTAVEHAAGHVLAVTGVALHHLIKQTKRRYLKIRNYLESQRTNTKRTGNCF